MERLKRLAKAPLVHFLLLGLVLLWAYARIAGPSLERDEVVDVDAAQIDLLRQGWMMQWRRPPTERELRGLIDAHIREEILYREALALGLDRDDTIVRRRLAQKMEFLSEDTANFIQPGPGELEAYYEENAQDYETPVAVSFSHVYFSVDRRGPDAVADAKAALEQLSSKSPQGARVPELGDRFMLQSDYAELDQRQIGELFGSAFGDAVVDLPLNEWVGPIESGYGLHLVRVRARSEASMPELSAVRDRVMVDWRLAKREEARVAYYDLLRQRYRVELDEAALGAALGDAPVEPDS